LREHRYLPSCYTVSLTDTLLMTQNAQKMRHSTLPLL
jgi:hypothetical protein